MYDVTYESEHSNTSVLDLSVTEESDGSFVGSSPEFSLSKVEWIIESNNWVKLLCELLKVSLNERRYVSTCLEQSQLPTQIQL
jgi:hypothetical protein